MIVIPCSTGTLAAIAHGISTNLLQRAADVCLKERKRLVVVPRETPLSTVHLENMLALSRMGVTVLPPEPAFYLHPNSMSDIVEFIVAKALDALGMPEFTDDRLRYQRSSE
jgi:4-hydroxy-3-polyprenylbenzoate decarboxylase